MTTYTIETSPDVMPREWTSYGIGDATGYESREDALDAIQSLMRTCTTPDWQDAVYRVVEVAS